MIGFIISLLVAAWLAVVHKLPVEQVFLTATNFLCIWYVIITALMAIIIVLILLSVITVGTLVKGLPGFLVAFVGGTTLTALSVIGIAIRRAMFILGAYTLHSSLTVSQGAYVWNIFYLILGGILLLIALKPRG